MDGSDSLSLRPIVEAVRHRLGVAVLTLLLCVAGGLVYVAAVPRVYEAQSSLYIDPISPDGLQQSDGLLSPYFVSEATSRRVLTRVLDSPVGAGLTVEQLRQRVGAQPLRGTNVIVVTADAESPDDAAVLANTLADAVVAQNRADASVRLKQTQQYLQGELDRIAQQLQSLRAGPAGDTQRQAQIALLEGQYSATYGRLQDVTLSQSRAADAVSVLERAASPSRPVQPQPPLDLAIALAAGLVLGLVIALAVERLDDRLVRPDSLGRAVGANLVAGFADGDSQDVISTAEAHLMARHPSAKVVLVAPAAPGDPAAEVARLLASAAAHAGRKVQMVNLVEIGNGRLSDGGHSNGSSDRGWPTRRSEEPDRLTIVAVPSPHLAPTAAALAQTADLAVVVGTAGRTSGREARRAAEALRQIGIPVEAAVLFSGLSESRLRRLIPWRRLKAA